MKVYLVGGAVRDKLLGYPYSERDWVVVGETSSKMLELGYKKVGKDFPVFLHPESKEEYALARTERKTASGYHGFVCDFEPSVTLEEDLKRRDITINAMAMDQNKVIDPYGGQTDLKNKVLRHVSPAFVEDPLRVIRVARFAARYYHLGFSVAKSTLSLMRKIVVSGELESLSKERIWQELQKSLLEKNPEIFICVLRECGALQVLFPEIDRLFGVPATAYYHPEVDTGVHTLMVLRQAAKISDKLHIRFAALVHDLGKGAVSMSLWPRQTGHEELGCDVIKGLCNRYRLPSKLRKFAVLVSRLHLCIHKVQELSIDSIVDTMEQADAFRNPTTLQDLLLVAKADSLGRGFNDSYPDIKWFFPQQADTSIKDEYTQLHVWKALLDNCREIKVSEILAEDISGEQIKAELRLRRHACVMQTIKSWDKHEK